MRKQHHGALAPAFMVCVWIGASLAAAQGPPPPLGGPLPGLTPAELASFQAGLVQFTRAHSPADGLGPLFNDGSCVVCHGGPAPGAGSGRLVTRFGVQKGKSFDPLESLGGSLIQARALPPIGPCNWAPEVVPPEANLEASRRTQPLFGLGLVDATPDTTFEALAAAQPRATAGRTNHVTEIVSGLLRVGRFGWKAQVPTLHQFSADALLNEMGITNPQFPDESCPQGDCSLLSCNPRPGLNDDGSETASLTDFQLLLAPAPRGPITPAVTRGEQTFLQIGCADCHTPTLESGPHPVAALDRQTYHPYSDFLLHDMGRLGDGIVQGEASGNEIRTAPLWGVRHQPRFLHDGRAATLEEATNAHQGQAAASRRRYGRLSDAERADLLSFLLSL